VEKRDRPIPRAGGVLPEADTLLVATVAEIVRDYFGYADNDYAIPCDEDVAKRLGRTVLERVRASGLKLDLPKPSRACRGR